MPQIKEKSQVPARSRASAAKPPRLARIGSVRDLMGRMLDYEAAASQQGVDLANGQFTMLTASEQRSLRAELVADYIRLSCANTGKTPDYFDETMDRFCNKICDLEVPSHELVGTYLAAFEIVLERDVDWLKAVARKTISDVLAHCVETLRDKTSAATMPAA